MVFEVVNLFHYFFKKRLLTTTTNRDIDLYMYYNEAGTYDVEVRPVDSGSVESTI